MMKYMTLLILSMPLLTSCEADKDQSTIENYIQDSFGKEALANNQLYVFVPKDICSTSIENLVDYFNTLSNEEKEKVTGVFIGNTLKGLEMLTNKLESKENILLDTKEKAYETEIISPHYSTIFINRSDGKSEILELNGDNIFSINKQIKKYLDEN